MKGVEVEIKEWVEYRRLRDSLEEVPHRRDERFQASVVSELRDLHRRAAEQGRYRNLCSEADNLVMRIQRGDFRG